MMSSDKEREYCEQIAERTLHEHWGAGYRVIHPALTDLLQKQRAAAAAEARERALEEAAAAVCEGCKAGYPTRWYPSGNWHEIKVVGTDYADRFLCRADAIRALMKDGTALNPVRREEQGK